MCRPQYKATQSTKNQINVTPPMETKTATITDPPKMEIYGEPDKEFTIIFLKKLSEI